MKIAAVSSGHVPSRWAHSIALAENANGFAQLGHDVDLLSVERFYEARLRRRIDSIQAFYGIDSGIDVRLFTDRTPFYFKDVKPVGLVLDGLTYATGGIARRIADPERRIAAYCAANGVDLCYCRSYRAVTYSVERGIPTVMEAHNPRIRKPSMKRALRRTNSPHFRLLVTISEQLKERYVEAGVPARKVEVLQDGVDLEAFEDLPTRRAARRSLDLPVDDDIVMYVGSLHPDKGIEQVLRAAARMPDCRFQLVGGGASEIQRWTRLAGTLGANNVAFSGHVNHGAVPTYLAAADVLVMPYDIERDVTLMDLESTSPLKLFEYLAAARPIVTSDIPAITRVVEHEEDALVAAPNDVDGFVRSIERSLTGDGLTARLGENAYQTARNYTWQARCARMLDRAGVNE